jgi:hypothetical protein
MRQTVNLFPLGTVVRIHHSPPNYWSVDREAEGTPLLREHRCKTLIVGSNPTRSAKGRKMHFTIPEEYITDVQVVQEYDYIRDRDNPTHEELIKALLGHDKSVTTYSKDHDEFTKLRDQLEAEGYIKTQRGWWNGDVVLKPFYLNGWRFKRNHKFPCAAALKTSITCARKYGWRSISSL